MLKKVISQLISSDQKDYVPGRFIRGSVRLTSDVLEYMKTSELHGYLITIDTEKAFDSVDHTFLAAVLKKVFFFCFVFFYSSKIDKNYNFILMDLEQQKID